MSDEYIIRDEAMSLPVLPKEQRIQLDNVDEAFEEGWRQALENLAVLPAADVVEVVHASWVWNPDGMDWGIGAWVCSKCKSRPETWWNTVKESHPLRCSGSRCCGNCGAIMDGGRDEAPTGPYDLLYEDGGENTT